MYPGNFCMVRALMFTLQVGLVILIVYFVPDRSAKKCLLKQETVHKGKSFFGSPFWYYLNIFIFAKSNLVFFSLSPPLPPHTVTNQFNLSVTQLTHFGLTASQLRLLNPDLLSRKLPSAAGGRLKAFTFTLIACV